MAASSDNIKVFWKFISENAGKINWPELQKDIDEKKTENLSESSVLFNEISTLFKKIHTNISFNLRMNIVKITSEELLQKIASKLENDNQPINFVESANKALLRYELILSVEGCLTHTPIVEQIYQTSKDFSFPDDLIVIKFYPPNPLITLSFMFKNVLVGPTLIKYYIKKINNDKLDIMFTVDDNLVKQVIKNQDDIYLLRNSIFVLLETIVGEYSVMFYITNITVIPESAHAKYFASETQNLKQLTSICQDLQQMIPTFKKCKLCHLNENHVSLEDDYCTYCSNVLSNLPST